VYRNGSWQGSDVALGSNTIEFDRMAYGYANNVLDGRIDEFRVYDRVLTSGEIEDLYEGKTIQPLIGDRRSSLTIQTSGGYY
jgi:hypothetical protein